MTDTRTVLITGATGKQGGAVVRHLAGRGFKIRAMTRKVDSDAAKSLAVAGAEIVKGDLDDAASIEAALTGAWGAFAVQNTWEAGVEGEEAQGKRFARVARKVGVQTAPERSRTPRRSMVGRSISPATRWPCRRLQGSCAEASAGRSNSCMSPSKKSERTVRTWR